VPHDRKGNRRYAVSARIARCGAVFVAFIVLFHAGFALSESRLAEFAPRVTPQEFFPQATRFGQPQGEPPILPVYAEDRLLGYVYLNSDFTGAVGYSGKPVNMLVGIDTDGVITGLKLVEHKEPIVLVGVPERKVVEAVNKLLGTRIGPIAAGKDHDVGNVDFVLPRQLLGAGEIALRINVLDHHLLFPRILKFLQ